MWFIVFVSSFMVGSGFRLVYVGKTVQGSLTVFVGLLFAMMFLFLDRCDIVVRRNR